METLLLPHFFYKSRTALKSKLYSLKMKRKQNLVVLMTI